jgi:hypothetical protein
MDKRAFIDYIFIEENNISLTDRRLFYLNDIGQYGSLQLQILKNIS